MTTRFRLLTVLLCTAALLSPGLSAQNVRDAFGAEYIVEFKDPAPRSFHITAVFRNLRQRSLDLALPVWTPGVYVAEDYAANVSGFTDRDAAGSTRGVSKIQSSSWRIDTAGSNQITIEFDYAANMAPGWNRAAITDRFAFFTGTELFLEAIGRRAVRSTIRFVVPPGWRIASALRETTDPLVYEAADYDELVDAPTVLGSFDVVRFDVEAKPSYFVTVPARTYNRQNVDAFVRSVADVMRTQRAIFGSLPYDKYLFFFFSPVTGFTGGNLEHANSSIYSGADALGEIDLGSVAHEFFHLWM